MALKYYKHKKTGEVKRSLKKLNDEWEPLITAPNQKFMVAANKATGTSKLKNSTAILTERARNHSRDHDIDDNIQLNKMNGLDAQVSINLLNSKGEKRRKIDDI
jgi:cell division GTPase FtsZ